MQKRYSASVMKVCCLPLGSCHSVTLVYRYSIRGSVSRGISCPPLTRCHLFKGCTEQCHLAYLVSLTDQTGCMKLPSPADATQIVHFRSRLSTLSYPTLTRIDAALYFQALVLPVFSPCFHILPSTDFPHPPSLSHSQ